MKSFMHKIGNVIRRTYDLPLWKWLLYCFAVSFFGEFLLEILGRRSLVGALSFVFHTPLVFFYNILIVFFTLSLSLLFHRRGFVMGLIAAAWLICGVTNCIVLGYRITPFSAIDILMVSDMFSMINIYFNIFQIILLFGGLLVAAVMLVLAFIKVPRIRGKMHYLKNILVCAGIGVVVALLTILNIHSSLISDKFTNLGTAYKDYGFAYCFSNSVVDVGIDRPADYSEKTIQKIYDETAAKASETDAEQKRTGGRRRNKNEKPDIIVIQLESFIDIDRVSGMHTDIDPIPNFNRFEEEYPSGYLTVPAIGAGTANTEFEILTGMKSKLFGAGEYPYKTVLTSTPCESAAQLLLRQGYKTHAMHNNKAKFYSRDESYADLGFQTFTSLEYMYGVSYTQTGWAKDSCLSPMIMSTLKKDGDDPSFVFTISVQGHGRYPKENLKTVQHVKLTLDSGDPELTNQFGYYVNQTWEMDQMIRNLKEKLDERGKPYVMLLYGDHIPSLTFDNNPLKAGADNQTEYVLVNNIGLDLPDQDLNAFEMSDVVMTALHLDRGIMQKIHQTYFDPADTSAFDEACHEMQYDMLYGEHYIYNEIKPYTRTDMQMGIYPISVTKAVYNPATGSIIVKGKNFTPFSRVIENDRRVETTYVDRTTLIILPDDVDKPPSSGDTFAVAQIDKDKHELTRTAAYTYP